MKDAIPGVNVTGSEYLRTFLSVMKEAEALIGENLDDHGIRDGAIHGRPKQLFCLFVTDVLVNSIVTLEPHYEILGSCKNPTGSSNEEIESAVRELLYIQLRKLVEGLCKIILLTHHNNEQLYGAFVIDEINKGWSRMLDHVNQAFGMEFKKSGDTPNRAFSRLAHQKKQEVEEEFLSKLDKVQRKSFNDVCNGKAIDCFKSAFTIANDQEKGLISLYPMLSPASNFVHFNIRRFSLLFGPPLEAGVLLAIICQTASVIVVRLLSVMEIVPSKELRESIESYIPKDSVIMTMLRKHYEIGEKVLVMLPSGNHKATVIECAERGIGLVVVRVDMTESNPPEYLEDKDKTDWFAALHVSPYSIE